MFDNNLFRYYYYLYLEYKWIYFDVILFPSLYLDSYIRSNHSW